MKKFFVVLRVTAPEDIFKSADSNQPPLIVQAEDGDPVGFCPVYASLEDLRKVHPTAEYLECVGQ